MEVLLNKLFDKHSEGYGVYDRENLIKDICKELKNLQLLQTGVSGSVCCDNQNISWDKHTISIDDKNGSYKDLSFNYCENCGQTFNVEF
jgi:hypothetical protein